MVILGQTGWNQYLNMGHSLLSYPADHLNGHQLGPSFIAMRKPAISLGAISGEQSNVRSFNQQIPLCHQEALTM